MHPPKWVQRSKACRRPNTADTQRGQKPHYLSSRTPRPGNDVPACCGQANHFSNSPPTHQGIYGGSVSRPSETLQIFLRHNTWLPQSRARLDIVRKDCCRVSQTVSLMKRWHGVTTYTDSTNGSPMDLPCPTILKTIRITSAMTNMQD